MMEEEAADVRPSSGIKRVPSRGTSGVFCFGPGGGWVGLLIVLLGCVRSVSGKSKHPRIGKHER